jgi:hypothetical protein
MPSPSIVRFLGRRICCISMVIRVRNILAFLNCLLNPLTVILCRQLQERLAAYKITVSRPDTQTCVSSITYVSRTQTTLLIFFPHRSKAVADGAVGFYCDHHVSARMSKFMYGVEFLRELDPNNPDHERRKEKLCELPSGPKLLPDAFDCILARVSQQLSFFKK